MHKTPHGSRLAVVQMVVNPDGKKTTGTVYRILESVITVDGWRTRVIDGLYPSLEAAELAREALLAGEPLPLSD